MTKQISLCNLLQTAFVWPVFVPSRETNPRTLSRRWEQLSTRRSCNLHGRFRQATACRAATESLRHSPYNGDNREKDKNSKP